MRTVVVVLIAFSTFAWSASGLAQVEPSPADERGRRASEALLRTLVGEEKADAWLTAPNNLSEPVEPETDEAIAQSREPGVLRTLGAIGSELRSTRALGVTTAVNQAELTLLGLDRDSDADAALNAVVTALYAAAEQGTFARQQAQRFTVRLVSALKRQREGLLRLAQGRDAPESAIEALKGNIGALDDLLATIDGPGLPILPGLKGFGMAFDIDAFRFEVAGQLNGEAVGRAFSIWKDGQPYFETAGGKARRAADQPDLGQTPTKPLNSASVAKVLTTVAALKLLEQTPGVWLDASIRDYLPQKWSKGPSLNMVSFRDLLRYCSGFLGTQQASADSYADLKAIIAAGVNSNYCQYENANFGMFRVIIPTMTGFDPSNYYGPLQPLLAAVLYANWVRDNVLDPAGISTGLCEDTTQYPTFYYRVGTPLSTSGQFKPIDLLLCGGGGWYLSASDWSRFLSFVRHTGFLSQASRKALYADPLGFALNESSPGVTHSKGGSWTTSTGAVRTCVFQSWNGVTATLVFNSDTKTISACGVLLDAYKNAWSFN